MELCIRWLLVVLLYGLGFSNAVVRQRRQSDVWWRSQQNRWGSSRALGQPSSRLGSPRANPWSRAQSGFGGPRALQPVSGFGGSRALQPVSGFGASRILQPPSRYGSLYPDLSYHSRQLLPPAESSSSPISVQCAEDRMVVMVRRDFYGNGKLVNPQHLILGSCPPGMQATDSNVVFENGLQECESRLEMTPDWLIYTVNLQYMPMASRNIPIIRSSPALVPIQCYYPRHGNVSSNPIKPTWLPFSTTVTSEERLGFGLQLMTEDWSAPISSPVFQIGDLLHIETSLETRNHVPMTLFIDSCVATTTPDVTSTPSYDIISNNGCLVDGMQEDSSSVFMSPRPEGDKLRFMVDAFRFVDSPVSLIYITCSLRAASIDQTPDPMNKACSYNKASSSWSPVEGSSSICQCCATGNCATVGGQRRQWGSSQGRMRSFGKRDVGSHLEEHGMATLGPIIVTGTKPGQVSGEGVAQASRWSAEREPLQLWVLVAIGSITSVVVAVSLIGAAKCLLKRFPQRIQK